MVISSTSCGDIHYAGLAKRTKNGICDLSFMTDVDASIPECQFNIGFRYRCRCDSWHNAKARRHLSEQNGLVLLASINCNSHFCHDLCTLFRDRCRKSRPVKLPSCDWETLHAADSPRFCCGKVNRMSWCRNHCIRSSLRLTLVSVPKLFEPDPLQLTP